jgi:hypothetical protein
MIIIYLLSFPRQQVVYPFDSVIEGAELGHA